MTPKPDVRVRAHTVYRVDLYDKPKTIQIADGLGMSQANEIAQALAEKHGGGHVRMSGSTTSYPVENVPTHLGPLYQELLSLPAGTEFHFRLHRSHQLPPVLYLEKIVPETVAEGDQPQVERLGLHIDTSAIQAMIRRELDKLKPTLNDLARDSSLREIKQVMKGVWEKVPKDEDEIEVLVEQVWARTGKAKSDLRQWAYVTLGDKLGEVPMTDRKVEIYVSHRAHGMEPSKAFGAAGWLAPPKDKAAKIEVLEGNPHVKQRIAHLRAQALADDGETVAIHDLKGNSTEAEFRSAIRGALKEGMAEADIMAFIVQQTRIGLTAQAGVDNWINEEANLLKR